MLLLLEFQDSRDNDDTELLQKLWLNIQFGKMKNEQQVHWRELYWLFQWCHVGMNHYCKGSYNQMLSNCKDCSQALDFHPFGWSESQAGQEYMLYTDVQYWWMGIDIQPY